MSVEYQNSILWRGEDPTKKKFQPRYDGTKKVTRYFPGQVPKWGDGGEGSDEEPTTAKSSSAHSKLPPHERPKPDRKPQRREPQRKPVAPVDDPRLRRLRASAASEGDGLNDRLQRHRVIHDARVLEEETEAQAKEEDDEMKGLLKDPLAKDEGDEAEDDAAGSGLLGLGVGVAEIKFSDVDNEAEIEALKREKARELALLRRKAEEEDILKKEELDEEDPIEDELDEEESEEESSEDDDPRRGALMKPVFVARHQRDTIREKENLAKEEEEAEERKHERIRERKVETKSMVVEEIRRDDEAEQQGLNDNEASDMELIDDDDEKNEAEEYEKWKIRELRRIKREKTERLEKQQELEWIERRRRMTDEEREADDRKLDSNSKDRDEVKQFNFLQKYYHRGGFFQDKARTGEEPLYLRDYHEPTAEETFDKNLLPKAMQVRRGLFGKKGQVKHTHLTDVDTTDMSAAWSQHSKQVEKYQERMAGAKGINNFDRPTTRGGGSSGSAGP
eukprot:TRINITY_DN39031_c0_g1_i1.p1 TRINITY_DN39031_c0_g1~~TRINITY_DN39031_c0_g1_i1.p1  ORF type:complete len:505 (+),score=200.34 TRINITY_DN39031_c0_g1_i1:186-1700(+)